MSALVCFANQGEKVGAEEGILVRITSWWFAAMLAGLWKRSHSEELFKTANAMNKAPNTPTSSSK